MHYKNSERFEELFFGRCSGGQYLEYESFNTSMMDLIEGDSGPAYPPTRLGELFFFGVCKELKRNGMNPEGLMFRSARRSRADIHHFTDGYFYLPSVPNELVTVDLFNLDSEICVILKDQWDRESEADFQTYLFSYKMGMAEFMKKSNKALYWDRLFNPPIFSSAVKRPENHFVLTPYYTESRQNRKLFIKLVAGHFIKVAKVPYHDKMAPLSH